jgi:hypothetical protein
LKLNNTRIIVDKFHRFLFCKICTEFNNKNLRRILFLKFFAGLFFKNLHRTLFLKVLCRNHKIFPSNFSGRVADLCRSAVTIFYYFCAILHLKKFPDEENKKKKGK